MSVRPATVRFAIIQGVMVLVIGAGLWLSYPAWQLGKTSDRLKREFPDVPQMTTADLAKWLVSNAVAPVLVDVRTAEDYAFSRLIESRLLDPSGGLPPDLLREDRDRAIVVICSTGERSTPFARRLLREGFHRVYALEGGVVRWANEGRPLTNGNELVARVRGDAEVTSLLKRAHRVPSAKP